MAKKKRARTWIKNLWTDFKAFINRGNAFNLAVGVVIGGVFNAIVTALVNILLSVCTWGVPGGLKGLVTVLPALNPSQDAGTMGWQNVYSVKEFTEKAAEIGKSSAQEASLFMGSYTQRGTSYFYNGCALINWGDFINAVISFLIVAITLFVIVKVVQGLIKRQEALKEKAIEEYYEKHPEERPVPVEKGAPAPTETELLTAILTELKKKNAPAKEPSGQ